MINRPLTARAVTTVVLIASMLALGGCSLFSNPHAQFSFDPPFDYPPLTVLSTPAHQTARTEQSPTTYGISMTAAPIAESPWITRSTTRAHTL